MDCETAPCPNVAADGATVSPPSVRVDDNDGFDDWGLLGLLGLAGLAGLMPKKHHDDHLRTTTTTR